jgi:hypothetical protein
MSLSMSYGFLVCRSGSGGCRETATGSQSEAHTTQTKAPARLHACTEESAPVPEQRAKAQGRARLKLKRCDQIVGAFRGFGPGNKVSGDGAGLEASAWCKWLAS